jgi:signal transduction histidine kinase
MTDMLDGIKNTTRRLFTRWRGSTLQLIAVVILPLTILLVAISFGSFAIHQNAMRSMVGERDQRSVQASASAIETELDHHFDAIRALALLAGTNPDDNQADILSRSAYLTGEFDDGVAFFNSNGELLSSVGEPAFWQSLIGKPELASVLKHQSEPSISNPFMNPKNGKQTLLISSYVEDKGLVAVAAFSVENLVRHTLQDNFPLDGQTAVYVIDSSYRILYKSGPAILEGEPARHPGVAQAFAGQSGTTYVQVGFDEHVVAYSQVSSLDWAIITEESWEAVTSPTLQTSLITPLILVPALLLAVLALWFGAAQIVKPLQALEVKAAKLAWGDFKEIEGPVYGIAEIRNLQAELIHMAHQLEAAQDSLHSYIGAITKGQEEERLRLARDLHDDTIQSLIALKQRVQLGKMVPPKETSPTMLAELETLTEQTIENLRRTTRALRPIYLEDLGLVAALEMLASETGQTADLRVEFQHNGSERRLPVDVELALYRMTQEALNNTARHAQATHASVKIEFKPQALDLSISDNGKGFEVPTSPAEFVPGGHFGLVGLYERTQLIGAQLEISSSPGTGTRLNVHLPSTTHSPEQ